MLGLFLVSAFFVAAIATVLGFGSATLLTPVAAYFLDIKQAIVLVAFFHFFSNLSRVSIFKGDISWRLVPLYGLPMIVTCFVGAWMVVYLPSQTLKSFFGLFLVGFVVSSFLSPKVALQPKDWVAVVGGTCTGFISGLLGVGGATRAMFLQAFNLPRDSYIATNASLALMADLTRIPTYLTLGVVNPHSEDVWLIPLLIVVAYTGTLLGRRIAQNIPQESFRKVILVALFFTGVDFLWRG
jgi:uncharacterized membrane protein YfcA